MPVTAKEVKDYETKVRRLQRNTAALEKTTRDEILKVIDGARVRVKDVITSYPDSVKALPAGGVQTLSRSIQAEVNQALDESMRVLRGAQSEAFMAGVTAGTQTAEAMGVSSLMFGPSVDMIAVAADYSADLIRTIGTDLIPKVNAELSRAALGGKSPYEAMQAIDALIGKSGAGGVSFQAERIVRDQIPRMFDIAANAQIEKIAGMIDNPDEVMEKVWVSGGNRPGRRPQHQEMDGVAVPVGEPFVMPDGTKLMYPRDPAGPAEHTIMCGCHFVLRVKDPAKTVRDFIMQL